MKKLMLCISVMFAAMACSGQKNVETVDAKTFQQKLKATPGAILLDVRTPEETAKGVIEGAQLIDFNSGDFEKKVKALDPNKTYFVYCARGGRSSQAVDLMSSLGFKKLYNLEGGFIGWQEKGMPVK